MDPAKCGTPIVPYPIGLIHQRAAADCFHDTDPQAFNLIRMNTQKSGFPFDGTNVFIGISHDLIKCRIMKHRRNLFAIEPVDA